MHWLLLAFGVAIEILATASLKLSDGFTKLGFAGLSNSRSVIAPGPYINCLYRSFLYPIASARVR